MRGGAVTRRDGATTGCAYSRQQIIREILYYVLTGPCGGALLALVSRQTHFSLISRVLKRIENNTPKT